MKNKVSPKNADIKAEENMLDASDPDSVLVAVARKIKDTVVCNIGIVHRGVFNPLLPDRVMEDSEATYFHLHGELMRLSQATGIKWDQPLKLAVIGLSNNISQKIKQTK